MLCTVKKYFLLLLIFTITLSACSGKQYGAVTFSPGVISLDTYNFNRDDLIPLNFQWEFYWKQLLVPADFNTARPALTGYISVPGVWNGYTAGNETAEGDGFATYRLRIRNVPPGSYGLKIPCMATAYRLWVNDRELASNGRVAPGKDMVPQQMPLAAFFKTGGEDVNITVQVSNYMSDKGGIWDKILFGTEQQIMKRRMLAVAFELMLFGSILIMSLYHFSLYMFRKKTSFTLYFGLVCFVIAVRILITGEFFLVYLLPGIDWNAEIKTEFLTVYSGFVFFLMFIKSLYCDEFSKLLVRFLGAVSLVFAVLTVFSPVKITAQLLPFFQVIIVAGFIYILYALALAMMHKRSGAAYIFTGCIILVLVVINDILDSNIIINTDYMFPAGLIIFIFSQSVILAKIFSESMNRVEDLSVKLQASYMRIDEYNRNLESMISERTSELADANEKLKELDRAKTKFFANISHELRTPLTLVLAPVENALAGKKMTRDSLELIHRNGRSLLFLINDLLDISRISAGRMTLELSECDLCGVVQRCCMDMNPAADMRGITLTCETPEIPVNVFIDESRIIRVINNLFSNSFKFTGTGGAISLKVDADRWNAHIYFSDTGCGIPSGKAESVFDRFVQTDSGTGKNHEGTGLGLSIVRELVELHGGSVSIESRHEAEYPDTHGSIFTVVIPLGIKHLGNRKDIIFAGKSPDNAAGCNPAALSVEMNLPVNEVKRTVDDDFPALLIVEDNYDLRKFLVDTLSESFQVYAAGNGNEAAALLESVREIDMVVSDIMMPGMDGYELLQWMREHDEFHGIPVIFLTARSDHFMKIEALGLGAVDYVTKPFNSDELLLRIKNQMEQKRMRNVVLRNYERLRARLGKTGRQYPGISVVAPVDALNFNIQHEDLRMEQICSFIREHYYEDITRESLAAAVDLNPDTFSRLFNQYTGKTLADYINECRVAEAKNLLAATENSVTRVSLETGFDSIRTFNRVFKKHTGMNPGEFRESSNRN